MSEAREGGGPWWGGLAAVPPTGNPSCSSALFRKNEKMGLEIVVWS